MSAPGLVAAQRAGQTTIWANYYGCMSYHGGSGDVCVCDVEGYQSGRGALVQVTCQVPTNFRQVGPGVDSGGGVLHFDYAWSSSTGNLSDLSICTVNEIVTYPGVADPYVWPRPPWNTATRNPAGSGVPGTAGSGSDNHTPGTFITPYQAANFTAVQTYNYTCGVCGNGTLYGPLNIVRDVSQNADTTWKYVITKSGASASINPLP